MFRCFAVSICLILVFVFGFWYSFVVLNSVDFVFFS
jgi:hypothetical protein